VRYDGTQPHPIELCVPSGATGHIMISEPAGATWPLPIVSPARIVAAHATRSGQTLVVSVTAGQHGTATLAVPGTSWQLEIAVP
jgi:hydrogenase maturation factor